jgi:ABC-type oligopeptide transport system ATPase subunit
MEKPAANAIPLIETRHLKKYFKVRNGFLHAVDDVSITIPRQKTLGVVGESGCGKSTLGRTILRLLEPTGGEVLFEGKNIPSYNKKQMHRMRREMQIIFQDPYSSINPRMSVVEIIAEYMIVHKMYPTTQQAFQRAAELMDFVGLARRYAEHLSARARRRAPPAHRHRARIVLKPAVYRLRRACFGARRVDSGADSQPAHGHSGRARADLSIHHPRPLGGQAHLRRDCGHVLGPVRRARDLRRTVREPAASLHQALFSAIPEPDIEMRNKEIKAIRGEVTSPNQPPRGLSVCGALRVCDRHLPSKNPRFDRTGPRHFVACHLFDAQKEKQHV